LTTDIYPSDYGWTPDWTNFEKRPSWYHNMLSVVQAGTCETSNQLDFDEEVGYHSVRKIYDLVRSEDKRPFFLLTSFTHPHDPFAITPEYWNRYSHDEIDLPAVPQIPYDQLDPHSQRIHHVCAMDQYAQTEERIRNARHAYYGQISYIDDKVGQLMQALQVTGLNENTIIVFVGDHGEMLGERGMWYKMSFFEWSARVPLIVHAPKRFASRCVTENVSLVDLLPTLVEMASDGDFQPFAAPLDGHSLLPLLQGESGKSTDTALGEMLGEGAIAPLLMIRNGRFKYIYSQPDPEQLYDLVADPHELHNLAADSSYQQIRTDFYDKVMAQWDSKTLHEQVLASQKRRRFVQKALMNGRYTPWEFQPHQDASQMYMRNHLDLNVLERTSRFPSPKTPAPDGEK
ncbi:MAG: choline-sulfatase, partial [Chloroflexi bacterium]|nr:choline-sulfatase [Chloroflexota bacterium]